VIPLIALADDRARREATGRIHAKCEPSTPGPKILHDQFGIRPHFGRILSSTKLSFSRVAHGTHWRLQLPQWTTTMAPGIAVTYFAPKRSATWTTII